MNFMKSIFINLVLAFSVLFVSCEKEETPENEEQEKQTIELLDSYKSVNGDITVNESYTYNDNFQLISISRSQSGSSTVYNLEYNTEGKLETVYQDDVRYASFIYSGSTVKLTSYYDGEVSSVRNCELNANNKIVREQSEGSEYYDTFVWNGDNMVERTVHSPNGETTTTSYTYNTDIMHPGFDKFFSYKHPMYNSKNACSESLWSYNNETTAYTLSVNDAGYLSKQVFTNILGLSTQTYSYKTVEIE